MTKKKAYTFRVFLEDGQVQFIDKLMQGRYPGIVVGHNKSRAVRTAIDIAEKSLRGRVSA